MRYEKPWYVQLVAGLLFLLTAWWVWTLPHHRPLFWLFAHHRAPCTRADGRDVCYRLGVVEGNRLGIPPGPRPRWPLVGVHRVVLPDLERPLGREGPCPVQRRSRLCHPRGTLDAARRQVVPGSLASKISAACHRVTMTDDLRAVLADLPPKSRRPAAPRPDRRPGRPRRGLLPAAPPPRRDR